MLARIQMSPQPMAFDPNSLLVLLQAESTRGPTA
jgi:hypothetical protein